MKSASSGPNPSFLLEKGGLVQKRLNLAKPRLENRACPNAVSSSRKGSWARRGEWRFQGVVPHPSPRGGMALPLR